MKVHVKVDKLQKMAELLCPRSVPGTSCYSPKGDPVRQATYPGYDSGMSPNSPGDPWGRAATFPSPMRVWIFTSRGDIRDVGGHLGQISVIPIVGEGANFFVQ